MFRVKKSIPLSEARQGYIYWRSRMYAELASTKQQALRELCRRAGGDYAEAVMDFVTTNEGATSVCLRHSISRETLDRAVRRYYLLFPSTL